MANADTTESTEEADLAWQKTIWYLAVGFVKTVANSALPAIVIIWKGSLHHHIDWPMAWEAFAVTGVPLGRAYWVAHKNLLKLPPSLVLPPEFQPKVTTKTAVLTTSPAGSVETSVTQTVEPAPPGGGVL